MSLFTRGLQWLTRTLPVLAIVGWTTCATAQQVSRDIPASTADPIRAVAAALAAVPDRADAVLDSVGFGAFSKSIPGYEDWPALRKIETGYLSAVAAGVASGGPAGGTLEGEKFLSAVAQTIARDHTEAVRYEPSLKGYFSPNAVQLDTITVHFAPLPAGPPPPPSSEVKAAVLAMEKYVERIPGGLQTAMAACCKLEAPEIYDILRGSQTRAEALAIAVHVGHPPPPEAGRVERLVRMVMETSHATQFDPALASLIQKFNDQGGGPFGLGVPTGPEPTPPPVPGSQITDTIREFANRSGADRSLTDALVTAATPPAKPQEPAVSRDRNQNEAAYEEVRKTIEPEGGTAGDVGGTGAFSFERMATSVGGFGGVVFGAPLDISKMQPATKLIWTTDIPDTNSSPGWGHFDVILKNGEITATRRFRSDDAYAALHILTGEASTFPPLDLDQGEGVGLASVNSDQNDNSMVVHPALFGLAIGDSAVFADAVGFKMGSNFLAYRLAKAGAAEAVIEKALDWRKADKGYYKIVDAPLEIGMRDGLLRVQRIDEDNYPAALRQVGYLRFQAMSPDDGLPQPESATPFYDVLPALIAAFPQFERLNSFAETFAILRWAKISDATIVGPNTPEAHEAQLYLYHLAYGDLYQSSIPLDPNQGFALSLMRTRIFADDLTEQAKSNGAPEQAQRGVMTLGTNAVEVVRLRATQEVLYGLFDQTDLSDVVLSVSDGIDQRLSDICEENRPYTDKQQAPLALSNPERAEILDKAVSSAMLDFESGYDDWLSALTTFQEIAQGSDDLVASTNGDEAKMASEQISTAVTSVKPDAISGILDRQNDLKKLSAAVAGRFEERDSARVAAAADASGWFDVIGPGINALAECESP